MKYGLIGHGYWGRIIEAKLTEHIHLSLIANSKTLYDNMLSELDWVFIATPVKTHYDIVKRCLLSQCNVFCEKPLTLSYQKSKELFSIAREHNVKLFVDNIFLKRTEIQKIKPQKNIKQLSFTWDHPSANGDWYDALVYHDIYLVNHILNNTEYTFKNIQVKRTTNKLTITFTINDINVILLYNKQCTKKSKMIMINDKTINLNNAQNDPLEEIISDIIYDQPIDYEYNKNITLLTEKYLEQIMKAEL